MSTVLVICDLNYLEVNFQPTSIAAGYVYVDALTEAGMGSAFGWGIALAEGQNTYTNTVVIAKLWSPDSSYANATSTAFAQTDGRREWARASSTSVSVSIY
jgi:hypothetical protein